MIVITPDQAKQLIDDIMLFIYDVDEMVFINDFALELSKAITLAEQDGKASFEIQVKREM